MCSAIALRQRKRMERLAPPSAASLLEQLLGEPEGVANENARRLAVAELNERLHDVSFALELLPPTYTALVRISLASGLALALFGALFGGELAVVPRACRLGLTAAGGVFGLVTVAYIGRLANRRAREIRERWDAISREIGKALGTSLDATTLPTNVERPRRRAPHAE